MPVHIGEKHLVKGTKRVTYSDKVVTGFALRTTPLGTFTFHFHFLNKATKKREWREIGEFGPEWSIEKARNEARGLADHVRKYGNLDRLRTQQKALVISNGMTFEKLHKAYIDDCKVLVQRRWGLVPRLEGWANVEASLKRPLEHWGPRLAADITDDDVVLLLQTWIDAGHPAMANNVRTMLHTMFQWAIITPRKWLTANPCAVLPPKAEERSEIEDGRVLDAEELNIFWHGLDDPNCPGDRRTNLALKLALTTMLRSGEIIQSESKCVGPEALTIPLRAVKGRRSKKARDVSQPLNSLSREIFGELFADDADRKYVFPGSGVRQYTHVAQPSLSHNLNRKSTDVAGMMGICEYLGLETFTPHDLRRTGATILSQLGYSDADIGKVMTHKAPEKDAAPVTRAHYIVSKKIIARPVDVRVKALDDLDAALREILGLHHPKALPAPPLLLTSAA